MESTIDPLHTYYFKALDALGPNRLVDLATFNWGFYLHYLPFLLFILAGYIGAKIGQLRPANNMYLFVFAILAFNLTVVINGYSSETSMLCTYTCYMLWRMTPWILIMTCCGVGGILAYTMVSRGHAKYIAVLTSLAIVGGLYLMASLTVNLDTVHNIAIVVFNLGIIALNYILFRPFYTLSVAFYCLLFFVLSASFYFEDEREGDISNQKLPTLRKETTNENKRCLAAFLGCLQFFAISVLMVIFALNPFTWR
jgi:hypothetical protein